MVLKRSPAIYNPTSPDSGRGIGNTADSVDRVVFSTRHPEGAYIPWGRGKYGGPTLDHPSIDRRDNVPVALGKNVGRGGKTKPPGIGLPPVVIQGRSGSPILGEIAAEINRRRPVVRTVVPPPVRSSPVPTEGAGLITTTEDKPMGLDLGQLIGDYAGAYIKNKFPVTPAGPINWGAGIMPVGTGGDVFGVDPGWSNAGLPGVEVISEAKLDKGWVYKKVCGEYKWIKPKRRRRKVLLTESDYNSLLRIQSLKVNQNMTVALAKTLAR